MSAAVVHYIKHWDNDTKGYIQFSKVEDLLDAIEQANRDLANEILQDAADNGSNVGPFNEAITITKAELVDSVAVYAGHVSSL